MSVAATGLELLHAVFDHMAGRVEYDLGAKAPSLTCDSSQIARIDCSGFTRYALARATDQALVMPDGSQAQKEWAACHLKSVAYAAACANGASDVLYIAFASPPPGQEWPRHVWLVEEGFTMESCGSRGVCSKLASEPRLKRIVSACFVLPTKP